MSTTGVRRTVGLLVLSACAALAVGAAAEDADQKKSVGPDVAPVGSRTTTATGPRFMDLIPAEDRERARQVDLGKSGQNPFPPTGVFAWPFYVADASHSVEWIGFLYCQLTDFDALTRTRFLVPLFLDTFGPDGRTLVTPLLGEREDEQGRAGFVLNYFGRRDRLADTDVVFPLFWSFRERDFDGGPVARSSGAVLPLVFWQRDTSGTHRTIGVPLFWRWGDSQETTTIVGNVYWHERPGESRYGAFPFYFGGRDEGGGYDFAPPLLFYRGTEGESSTTFILNTLYRSRPTGFDFATIPFVFAGKEGPEHYLGIPLALTFQWGDGSTERTLVANTYCSLRPNGYTFNSLPLVFLGREGDSEHQIVAPIFWRFADKESSSTTLFPLWFSGEKGDERYDVIPPLLFGRSSDAESSATWLLNSYYSSRKDGYTFDSLPLVFFGREGDSEHQVVAPIFWHFADKESTSAALFPLWFFGEKGDARYDVIPPLLFGRASDAESSTTWLLNSYYSSRKDGYTFNSLPLAFFGREGDSEHQVVAPLFFRVANDAKNESTLVVPPLLFGRSSDAESSTTWLLNSYYASRKEGYSFNSLPLVFWGREGDSEHQVVAPIFWRFADKEHSNTAIFPLWFSGERGDERYDVIPPLLFGRSSDAESSTTWLLNSYYASRKDGYSFNSLPLVFFGRRDDSEHQVVAPLYWRFADKESTNTAIFPLYFFGEKGDERYDVIPPLLFGRASDAESSTTWLLNTYYSSRKDGYTLDSFPLAFFGRSSDAEHQVVAPVFWRFADKDHSNTAIFPLWFSGERGDERYDVIPPLLFGRASDAESSTTWLLNSSYSSRTDGYTFNSLPLVFWGREGDATHQVVAPIFWRFADKEHSSTAIFPLWFSGERGDERYDVIPPLLFGRASDAESSTTWLLNSYYSSRKDGYTFNSLPLAFFGRDGDSEHQIVAPLFFRTANDAKNESTVVVPPLLFGHSSDPESSSTWLLQSYYSSGKDGYTFDSFPLVFWGRDGSAEHQIALPFFLRFADETKSESAVVIPPLLFGHASDPESSTTWVANTYYSSRSDGYTLASIPLVFSRAAGSDHSVLIPPLLTYHGGDGETERTLVANTYIRLGPGGWSFAFAPLVFAGRDGDDAHTIVFPLVWRFADAKDSTTVVGPFYLASKTDSWNAGFAPLWFSGRDTDGTGYDVVAPLFWHFSGPGTDHLAVFPLFDYASDETHWRIVTPLLYHDEDKDSSSTIVLGLYWSLGSETHARVLFPLFWDFTRPETKSELTTFFPVFWRYERDDETTCLCLNTAWSSATTARGSSWSFHVFPFVDLGSDGPEHFRWQVFCGMFGHERDGELQRSRIFYVWTDPGRS